MFRILQDYKFVQSEECVYEASCDTLCVQIEHNFLPKLLVQRRLGILYFKI